MATLSVTGAPFNLKIRKGASLGPYTVTATYKATRLPIDLTGATLTCQLRETANSATVAATVTCTLLDAAAGTFTVEMADEITDTLAVGDYKWDLIIESADGRVTPWWRGTVTVTEGVSR